MNVVTFADASNFMDIPTYISLLDTNTNDTLELAKKCTAAQLNFKDGSRWSVMEVLEHIYIVDKICFSLLSRPAAEKESATNEIYGNEKMKHIMIANRKRKVESPAGMEPKGSISDVPTFVHLFLQQRNLLKQDLLSNKITVSNKTHRHPTLGEMTIADWLYFMVHHANRHLEQIKENMAALATKAQKHHIPPIKF
jgi:hypothetical protein